MNIVAISTVMRRQCRWGHWGMQWHVSIRLRQTAECI